MRSLKDAKPCKETHRDKDKSSYWNGNVEAEWNRNVDINLWEKDAQSQYMFLVEFGVVEFTRQIQVEYE